MRRAQVIFLALGLGGLAAAPAVAQPVIDEPPELTRPSNPTFPARAIPERVEAKVELDVEIGVEGYVENVSVLDVQLFRMGEPFDGEDIYGFGRAALAAGAQLEFTPARSGGEPVPIRVTYTYNFVLPIPGPPSGLASVPPPAPGKPDVPPPPEPVVNLRGQLLERGTRKVLSGITVTVYRGEGDDAVGYDATSDEDGEFELYDLEPGTWNVLIDQDGYLKYETRETVKPDERVEVTYYVERGSYNPYDVLVEAERPKKEVSRRTLQSSDIAKVPGTLGDPVTVVENLPGVARTTTGEIIVRGSGPTDTGIFIDGVTVPLIYHFGGLKSVVPAQVVESIDFYPGNYSVEYGRAMGGIFDLHIGRLEPDRVHGSLDVSVLDTSLYLEAPVTDDAAIAIAGRRSYVDFVLDATIPDDTDIGLVSAPRYYDYQVLGNWRPSREHEFRGLFLGSDDLFEILFEDPADTVGAAAGGRDVSAGTAFQRISLEHRFTPDVNTQNRLKFSVGRDQAEFRAFDVFRFDLDLLTIEARDTLTRRFSPNLKLETGVDFIWLIFSGAVKAPPIPREGEPMDGFEEDDLLFSEFDDQAAGIAPFVQAEWKLGDLTLIPGLRLDYFSRINEASVDPRIVATYDLGRFSVKGGAAVVHQQPDFPDVDPVFGNPDLGLQRALQFSAGGEWRPTDFINVDATLFYKDLQNLVAPSDALVERDGEMVPQRLDNDGAGRVYGLEMFVEHEFANNLRGWLSYTLSRAERKDPGDDDYRLFDYDQTHIFAVVGSYVLPGNWELGLRWRLVSGSPYTPFIGGVFVEEQDQYQPIAGPSNSERLPMFQQLDLRVDKTWVFDVWKLSAYLSLINAYNHENVENVTYNYDYTEEGSVNGLPILPIFGVKGEW